MPKLEAAVDDRKRQLLGEILDIVKQTGRLPIEHEFRIAHESDRAVIDDLLEAHLIGLVVLPPGNRYKLTLDGLRAMGSEQAHAELTAAADLIPALKDAYRSSPQTPLTASTLVGALGKAERDIERALTHVVDLPISIHNNQDWNTGLTTQVLLAEPILDASPSDILPFDVVEEDESDQQGQRFLTKIEIDGYRPFRGFEAEPGALAAIIGANAAGKSSLFDFLRFVSRAVQIPLPPEIDERSVGRRLFHAGGPERIKFGLTLDFSQAVPIRYQVEIAGPVGSPRVVAERLATTRPIREGEQQPFLFLDFRGGRGVVRDQRARKLIRPEWTLPTNELALRRALDPTLVTLSRVQGLLSSWRFYSGFDVSSESGMRRPAPTEPEPILREDGSNLSAVLAWLNRETWSELESTIRSAVPGFRSLDVKPRGGPGTVMGLWNEDGVQGELTLADLSDGTLRFLCWAVLCLSTNLPPLLCIDEPELGLHPRVLPVLAGLLRLASNRTQVLVATHSPYFLSHFALAEIAVMRKRNGVAEFVRPESSNALRTMVEELGAEAIMRLHVSDELETLP